MTKMKTIKQKLAAVAVLTCLALSTPALSYAGEVIVTIKNIENSKGNMRIGIFTSDENFQNHKMYKLLTYSKSKVNNGTMTIRLTLPAGEYGISLLDDENKNEKMDYNILHIPKEGFSFSDYYHTSFSMPKFKNFSFKLADEDSKNITVKVRYM